MLVVLSVIVLFSSTSLAHLCLVQPPQRGGFDISKPGALACYQPDAPCGDAPATAPTVTVRQGSSYTVLLQQNVNHFNAGWRGHIDIAWAMTPNATDDDFTVVQVIPDFWAHMKDTQTNFSVAVRVPDVPCTHCVLRARYVSNKPTEPIFHQCTDVAVKQSQPLYNGRLFAIQQSDPFGDDRSGSAPARLVEVFPAGTTYPSAYLDNFALSEGLVAANAALQRLYFVGESYSDLSYDLPASTLYTFDVQASIFVAQGVLKRPANVQWTALLRDPSAAANDASLLIIGQQAWDNQTFSYAIWRVSAAGLLSGPLVSSPANDSMVNFMWATMDDQQNVYVLSADENAHGVQDALLYTLNVKTGVSSAVFLAGTVWTVTAVHWLPGSNQTSLLAVSPGPPPKLSQYESVPWSLVSIDPASGVISPTNTSVGSFAPYYGGNVYGGLTESLSLLHVFTQGETGGSDLYATNATGSSAWVTSLQRGVNNIMSLTNFVYLRPSS
eukprot:TRINITY_DN6149_c0_g1_i2.p1 TRINITY_DN6149_c0_g1~~TRINITY_DN6149_c0_g1_i2.p1  ORF type:complete len:513 (+),score=136.27 TRINITY_DN6149_c0_g1_i2:49-1539(+)